MKNWLTFSGASPRWGTNDPGTVPSATRNSSTRAVRIEVSCRHPQRSQPSGPMPTGRSRGAWGEDCASGASVLVSSVLVVNQITVLKPDTQPCILIVRSVQAPVTRSSPIATSIPPPTRITAR